jgi:hypothetical protein
MRDGSAWHKMSSIAVIHFTNAKEHKFSCPATVMGKLTTKSWDALKKLFIDGMTAPSYLEKFPQPGPHRLLVITESSQGGIAAHRLIRKQNLRSTLSNLNGMATSFTPEDLALCNRRGRVMKAPGIATPSMAMLRSRVSMIGQSGLRTVCNS